MHQLCYTLNVQTIYYSIPEIEGSHSSNKAFAPVRFCVYKNSEHKFYLLFDASELIYSFMNADIILPLMYVVYIYK